MKVCAAQIKPLKGNIENNIENHRKMAELAVSNHADMIVFPELSITGYEPELANELATGSNDNRFGIFERISDSKHITIGIGMPLKSEEGILISMVLFQPGRQRQVYSKQYLHKDELPYFSSAGPQPFFETGNTKIAFAICYELSVPLHAENAAKNGADIYIACVAKSAAGTEKAMNVLQDIAGKYSIPVLYSNCIGPCDNFMSNGRSSAWNKKGELVAQLNETDEGILIFDTVTGETIAKAIPAKP